MIALADFMAGQHALGDQDVGLGRGFGKRLARRRGLSLTSQYFHAGLARGSVLLAAFDRPGVVEQHARRLGGAADVSGAIALGSGQNQDRVFEVLVFHGAGPRVAAIMPDRQLRPGFAIGGAA